MKNKGSDKLVIPKHIDELVNMFFKYGQNILKTDPFYSGL